MNCWTVIHTTICMCVYACTSSWPNCYQISEGKGTFSDILISCTAINCIDTFRPISIPETKFRFAHWKNIVETIWIVFLSYQIRFQMLKNRKLIVLVSFRENKNDLKRNIASFLHAHCTIRRLTENCNFFFCRGKFNFFAFCISNLELRPLDVAANWNWHQTNVIEFDIQRKIIVHDSTFSTFQRMSANETDARKEREKDREQKAIEASVGMRVRLWISQLY